MSIAYLSLGSNLNDRKYNIDQAIQHIEKQIGAMLKQSSLYETESWGAKSENLFLNMVVSIETRLGPTELLNNILEIEQSMGRMRSKTNRYLDRIIDIDILFFDNIILQTENLTIPHPLIANRRFVLEPLCEIAPELSHPVKNETIQVILKNCKDNLMVKKC